MPKRTGKRKRVSKSDLALLKRYVLAQPERLIDREKAWLHLMLDALRDAKVRRRLLVNPKAVFEQYGYAPPKGARIKFLGDDAGTIHIVLPEVSRRTKGKGGLKNTQLRSGLFGGADNDDWDLGDELDSPDQEKKPEQADKNDLLVKRHPDQDRPQFHDSGGLFPADP